MMFWMKQNYCLHTCRKIADLSVRSYKISYVKNLPYTNWRYITTAQQILSIHKIKHNIPLCLIHRTIYFRKDGTSGWHHKWCSEPHTYKVASFIVAILVGGIVIKSMLSLVTADEEYEEIKPKKINVLEVEDFYIDGKLSYSEAVRQSRAILNRKKVETGSPGISVAVSVDGKTVWAEGFGYSDVENLTPCTAETVLRIASISKPIAMVTVAKQVETGALDLDAPVQQYVPEFPEKTWEDKKVKITTRQLLCHLSGIRNYDKAYFQKTDSNDQNSTSKPAMPKEFLIMKNYKSVFDGLELFKDDPLVHAPGSKFYYTTHGWTLISAVVEKVASEHKDYVTYLKKVLKELGMNNTYPEYQSQLIPNRGRHYIKDEKGRLINAPYVDLSYKWAGGGLISNVLDVVKFGNAMLYSYQADNVASRGNNSGIKFEQGYLKSETMKMMWTPVKKTENFEGIPNNSYGLGWGVHSIKNPKPCCQDQRFYVSHTGGAVGASSVLLILPRNDVHINHAFPKQDVELNDDKPPKGVVVAIIANMSSVGFINTAYSIAKLFDRMELKF